MKNFNWDDFKNNKIGVFCPTKEIAKDFLKKMEKKGYRLKPDSDPSLTFVENGLKFWSSYKEQTCFFADTDYTLCYGDLDYAQRYNYLIIYWYTITSLKLRSNDTFNRFFGILGLSTNFTDINDESLFTGDVVEIFDENLHSLGYSMVICDIVTNIKSFSDFTNLKVKNGCDINKKYIVIKRKSYSEFKANDKFKEFIIKED